jgi:hypothetical protein
VVHQFSTDDKVLLLAGDGVIGARETVPVHRCLHRSPLPR